MSKPIKLKDLAKELKKEATSVINKKIKELNKNQIKPLTNNVSPSLRAPILGRKVPKR